MTKRILSLVLAMALLTVSMTGCGNKPAEVATFDGGSIPAGVFILNKQNQYNNFMNYTGLADLSTKVTEDETLEEIIDEDAVTSMKAYAANETECKRLGIELTEEEMTALMAEAKNNYEANKGVYEKKGIGLASVEKTGISNALSMKLLNALYGKDGEMAVTEDEKKEYLKNTYRKATIIDIPFVDEEGKLLEGEAKELKAKEAEDIYNEITEGSKSFMEVFKEVNEKKGLTVAEGADEKTYATLISANDTRFAPDFVVSIFKDEPTLGKVLFHKAENNAYIYILRDVFEDNFLDTLGDSLIYEMKRDDFTNYLLGVSENINLTFDESAVKAYSIKEIAKR